MWRRELVEPPRRCESRCAVNMKEFFAAPPRERATELERARMRKALDAAPARVRGGAPDHSDAILVSELRAVRNEVASLRELLADFGQAPSSDEILTRKQVADLLGWSVETVTKRARVNGLPHKLVGKEYRFLRSQVLAWLAARGDMSGDR